MEGISQERIEYCSLQLQCSLAVQAILSFRTMEMPGEHGRGVFRVRLQAGTGTEQITGEMYSEPVALQEVGPEGNPKGVPLFSGYLEEVRLFETGGYREAEITALSGTVLLDRRKRDRVFQMSGQGYGDILGRVTGDTENSAYILTAPDRKTEGPFFQYRETDWEFLKRVAGCLGLPLVADASYHYPRFYIGLRRGAVKKLPSESSRTLAFDGERFYEMKEKGLGVAREDFFCYDITTWTGLGLGERVRIDGKELSVVRKEMVLQDGGVAFHYRLAGKSHSLACRRQNTDMIGLCLQGKVTGTDGQTCELALDLEPGQSGGYAYPYAPETGNLMYCMPQTETRVSLDLGNGEGADAMVSGSIRTNGAECEGTGEPPKKSFHTEYGRGMELYPESMSLTGGLSGSLLLDDAGGASLTSAGCLIAYAVGNIRLESGKTVDMETLSGVFAQALQEATSSLCINERFDYLSSGALLRGENYYAYPPYDDAPKEGKFDWGGFFRNIAIGLAVVAVCVAAAAAVVATGGGAAVVFAAGAAVGPQMAVGALVGAAIGAGMTTVSMSVQDFNDGDVRSWQEAAREIGISAISGAITGAIGVKFPHMNKLLAGLIDTTLSTVERGFLKAFEEDVTFSEWLAYTFDPKTIAFDFAAGVTIDCVMDGITDFFKGRNASQLVDGMSDQVSDAVEDGMTREVREAMEDGITRETREAMEDSAQRAARETAEETAERATRETTGDFMDDFDEYERFYEDMFERQRESFGEYEDFLDDLRELPGDTLDASGSNAFKNADLLNDNGSFADELLEERYQDYVQRNTKSGKNVRERLDWKEASDTFAALREQGRKFELEKIEEFRNIASDVEEQITIVTNRGTKIRVDAIGYDKETGAIIIQEYKSSATAPFTDNQIDGFPELFEGGGTIVGEGKGAFPGGMEIPPGTKVDVIRPE